VRLYELCRAGQWQEAMALQRGLWRINRAFARYNLAACIKGALELQGYEVGAPLAPQTPLSDAGRAEVRQLLADLGAV
jgi:dihydrodipicolinate synthase/N-acetylneuraminate lyase